MSKFKKFLKPVEVAIAALLSIATPYASAQSIDNVDQTIIPSANAEQAAKSTQQKPLLIQPSNKKQHPKMAGHYSHSSHSSHSSHASHYSSSQ